MNVPAVCMANLIPPFLWCLFGDDTILLIPKDNVIGFKIFPKFSEIDSIRDSIVASIPACHAGDRGSIPRRGVKMNMLCEQKSSI